MGRVQSLLAAGGQLKEKLEAALAGALRGTENTAPPTALNSPQTLPIFLQQANQAKAKKARCLLPFCCLLLHLRCPPPPPCPLTSHLSPLSPHSPRPTHPTASSLARARPACRPSALPADKDQHPQDIIVCRAPGPGTATHHDVCAHTQPASPPASSPRVSPLTSVCHRRPPCCCLPPATSPDLALAATATGTVFSNTQSAHTQNTLPNLISTTSRRRLFAVLRVLQ